MRQLKSGFSWFACLAMIGLFALVAALAAVSSGHWTDTTQTTSDPSMDTTTASLNLTVLNSTCWVNGVCNVAADLTRVHLNFKFPVILNCSETIPAAIDHRDWQSMRFQNISMIALNGCNVNREDTLGVEYVPDPASVRSLSIRMFRIAGDIAPDTFLAYDQLESLELLDNIVGGVANDSLKGLTAIRSLSISNNNLQYMDDFALTTMTHLTNLTIREPLLNMSRSLMLPDLVKMVIEVGRLEWWSILPASLQHLSISKITYIEMLSDDIEAISNLTQIHTFQFTQTKAIDWPGIGSNSMHCLNLSHNQLQSLNANDLPLLNVYDVSFNQIKELHETTTRSMHKLRFFFAQSNLLETIAPNTFVQNAYLEKIDLTGNRLRHFSPQLSAQQDVYIHIDDNDWGCRWALDMSSSSPHVFSHFRYAKTLDSLNIRGLRCKFFEQPPQPGGRTPPYAPTIPTGVPTYVRRNPKDTAILTLIILVVGVAFLFLLLFLHIKCRRDGLQPFNRFLPPPDSPRQLLGERIDFVRRDLPPTAYEDPIRCRLNSADGADTEKPFIDAELVYEEIPDRRAATHCDIGVEAGADDALAPTDPTKYIGMATFFEKFNINSIDS